ncbi:hypothetical protein RvY_17864 [Ramazzottius varieornatus]|uniref:Uncharacterized protein n=1 Tax=Ramazzottius varieornatus TaxID=947166 RepID=A0A1D1W9D3_RAMVA|nr:hypothetical protein RvY_17864 [Ramazzottius varieornatus]
MAETTAEDEIEPSYLAITKSQVRCIWLGCNLTAPRPSFLDGPSLDGSSGSAPGSGCRPYGKAFLSSRHSPPSIEDPARNDMITQSRMIATSHEMDDDQTSRCTMLSCQSSSPRNPTL